MDTVSLCDSFVNFNLFLYIISLFVSLNKSVMNFFQIEAPMKPTTRGRRNNKTTTTSTRRTRRGVKELEEVIDF